MKYVALIDYMANKGNNGFDFIALEAKNETQAIIEADHMMNDDIYLIKLMKKTGKAEKIETGIKATKYTSILVRRRHNWHASDKDGENVTTIYKYVSKHGTWFDF